MSFSSYTPPSPVTLAAMQQMSGSITSQIGQSSGVSVGLLDATSGSLHQQILTLSGTSIVDGVISATTNGPATRLLVDTYNSTNVFGSSIRGRRARGTESAPSGIRSGDVMLQLVGDGYAPGSGFIVAKVSLVFFAAEDWDTESAGTYTIFRTTPTGSLVVQERMRLTPDGRLGIGTTTPGFALDVAGPINATALNVGGVPFASISQATLDATGAALRAQIAAASGMLQSQINALTPIGGPTAFAVSVPTGVASLSVVFPVPYLLPPLVAPSFEPSAGVTYQVAAQTVTAIGYTASFSDTILEPGGTLTTAVFPSLL